MNVNRVAAEIASHIVHGTPLQTALDHALNLPGLVFCLQEHPTTRDIKCDRMANHEGLCSWVKRSPTCPYQEYDESGLWVCVLVSGHNGNHDLRCEP